MNGGKVSEKIIDIERVWVWLDLNIWKWGKVSEKIIDIELVRDWI